MFVTNPIEEIFKENVVFAKKKKMLTLIIGSGKELLCN